MLEPEVEVGHFFEPMNLTLAEKVLEKNNFNKPNQTDMKRDLLNNGLKQIEKWQTWLTQKEKESIQEIFNHFGLKIYSAFDALP